jgi:hypothetical protein
VVVNDQCGSCHRWIVRSVDIDVIDWLKPIGHPADNVGS